MKIAVITVYWIIVALWIAIVITVAAFYFINRRAFGTTRLLLAVLAIDGCRNIAENIYFGLYFGSGFGFLSPGVVAFLGNPRLLILPKLANIGAGCIVLSVLLLRWLPQAIRERTESERQVAILHELATKDGMTGLFNRHEFRIASSAEWQRARRYNHMLSLLVIDIDNFKTVNDRFGHDAGDQIIIGVANICQSAKRTSDIAGRLGGEEFGILLPETGPADAAKFAERLRRLIARLSGAGILATVSIGVSDASKAESIDDLFKQADTALYAAKHAGRNTVRSFPAPAALPG